MKKKIILPDFLEKDFYFYSFSKININNLYVAIHPINSTKPHFISIYETPHYQFVQKTIFNRDPKKVFNYENYFQYAEINKKACSEEEYTFLINNILVNGYNWKKHPIFIYRNWRRIFPISRWNVADGFHRLAILAALNFNEIEVGILKYKYDLIRRFLKSLQIKKNSKTKLFEK